VAVKELRHGISAICSLADRKNRYTDRHYTRMKTLYDFIIVFCLVAWPIQRTIVQTSPSAPRGIELKLIASKSSVRVDEEPIVLKIELWNKSSDNFLAGVVLGPFVNQAAYLRLEGWDKKGERIFLLDSMRGIGVSTLDKWWNLIPPGHYFGTEYKIDSPDFGFAKTPGSYLLTATYVSRGGITPSIPESGIPAYNVWKGELASNAVRIEILPSARNPKQK